MLSCALLLDLRKFYLEANVVRATSDGQVVLGDKDNARATAHFNKGHVLAMAAPGGAPGGANRVTELKVYSPTTKHQDMGRGSSKNGGTPSSVGRWATSTRSATPRSGCGWKTSVAPRGGTRPTARSTTPRAADGC